MVDQDGIGASRREVVSRRRSIIPGAGEETTTVPMENREVKPFWHNVVVHQGWLLKKEVRLGDAKTGSNVTLSSTVRVRDIF